MHILEIITLILIITTLFSFLNEKFLKQSPTIGTVLISLAFSLMILSGHRFMPSFSDGFQNLMGEIKFDTVLLKVMLGSLLFAGAFNLDIKMLNSVKKQVISSALVGTLLSTALFAFLFWGVSELMELDIPFIYALLFGSLISPTDPIATLAILKENKVNRSVEYKISGESLFNDAIGVVLFITILDIIEKGTESVKASQILLMFVRESFGGIILGFAFGYLAFGFLQLLKNRNIILLFSLSLVLGISLLAERIGVSQPLAVIFSGLVLSTRKEKMEIEKVKILEGFWEDVDGMLNLILFILIGLESVLVFDHFNPLYLVVGLLGIIMILLSRFLSVGMLLIPEKLERKEFRGLLIVLTWGALRGGLAFALALSIPESPIRHTIVIITYIIVIFSIVIQGLSIGKLAKKYV